MKNLIIFSFLLLLSYASYSQDIWVKYNNHKSTEKSDTGVFVFNPYSTAFFDDKEFTSNIKKGYTHPGYFLQPMIKYQPNKRSRFSAGFHTMYFAGADSVEKIVPIVSLEVKLIEGLEMILGSIHSKQMHFLPEPIFKPERLYINQPEVGVQFLTNTEKIKLDSWTNWERYIKNGSPFQEVFTMGFSGIAKPSSFDDRSGLLINFFGIGVHHGGQIDSTNLPVNTTINLGAGFSYSFPIKTGKSVFGLDITGFLSSDKSPNPTSKYQNGNAVYPKIFIESETFRGEIGYFHATKFVNPRGEELFGSYSTVNSTFDSDIRNLYTAKFIYSVEVAKGFNLGARFDTYYDPKNSLFDWAFTFRMVFDRDILLKK